METPRPPESYPAPEVDDAFIKHKIERAWVGITYFKVTADDGQWAKISGNDYTHFDRFKEHHAKRTKEAAISIFFRLVNRKKCFETEGVHYIRHHQTGKWSRVIYY